MILAGTLIFLALISLQSQLTDPGVVPLPENNMIGTVGHYSARLLFFLFGKSAFLLGPYLFLLGFLTFYRGGFNDPLSRVVAVLVVMAGTSLLGALLYQVDGHPSEIAGGLLGARVGQAFQVLFGTYGGFILAMGIFLTGVFLAIRVPVPVFLGQMNNRIVQAIRAYSRALNGEGQIGYRQAYAAAGADTKQHEETMHDSKRSELLRREVVDPAGDRRPWVERVQVSDEPEAPADAKPAAQQQQSAPESDPDILYNDFPDETAGQEIDPGFSGLNQRTRLSNNARHLQDALSRIEQRRGGSDWLTGGVRTDHRSASPEERLSTRGSGRTGEREFAGYFNEDESRFHFRAAPVPRRPGATRDRSFAADSALLRRARSAPDSSATHGRSDAAVALDGESFLEPLDLELIQRRPRASNADFAGAAARRATTGVATLDADFAADGSAPLDLENDLAAAEIEAADLAAHELAANEIEEFANAADAAAVVADEFENDAEPADEFDDSTDDGEVLDDDFDDAPAAPRAENVMQPRPPAPVRKVAPKPVPVSAVPRLTLNRNGSRRYHLPANLLKPAEAPPREDVSRELEVTRERLEKVMQDYGIQARVVRTQRGPIITLYEVKLEAGVRVSRILGISDEIKMNLEAPSIRIIAPIPGKPTVGIEIPNRHREGVVLGDMLDRDVMSRNELCVVLGKNIAGEKQYVDLARLPHLLIAGSTGSGKSVYMNAIIASLLYTRSPEDVRFIVIDPKMVELKLFEGIPQLIMPVITDVRQASKALTWVINEMERRYEILSHLKSRDIRSYNDRVAAETRLPGFETGDDKSKPGREKMPYIVVFIDELSDLMMVAAKDVEDSIIRLTQKARAVGIHVVMATQRPSVDVITALIKANCPARIAFHVAQKTDSRTILDMNGAETLLGKGDMLYRSPSSTALVRLQAPLLTEEEIESVVQEAARYGQPAYVDLEAYIEEESTEAAENDVDAELLQQAWKIVQESGKTSTSYIQRRLRIGYNRAASLIEQLEHKGYLSPAVGNKPREILKRS